MQAPVRTGLDDLISPAARLMVHVSYWQQESSILKFVGSI
jgi:hypothetical protein